MRYYSLLEPPTQKFINFISEKKNWKLHGDGHPQEDFLIVSDKYPIYIVADGVTLIQFLIEGKEYPSPSPAGEVARIFCAHALKAAEDLYETFEEENIKDVFKKGNDAVREYNLSQGRTSETTDFWHNDLYAATAAFSLIKEGKVYWGTICDSYIITSSEGGEINFRSPDCDDLTEDKLPIFAGGDSQRSKAEYSWKFRRNRINDQGKRVGYGVVTGEPEALEYLSSGSFEIGAGDLLLVLTDGFEEYTKLPEFISLLKNNDQELISSLKAFTTKKAEEDPDKYGHERSLIAVKF
jgi:hypothetical protein